MYKKRSKNNYILLLVIVSLVMSSLVTYAAGENIQQEQGMLNFIEKVLAQANVTVESPSGIEILIKTNHPQGNGNDKNTTIFLTKEGKAILGQDGFGTLESTLMGWLGEAFKSHGGAKQDLESYGFEKATGTEGGGNNFVYTVSRFIHLTAKPKSEENAIELKWNAPSTSNFYNYTVYRKQENTNTFQSISSINIDAYKEAGKKVKVLNLHPNKSGAASLKTWMENNGYGKGVLSINPVKIDNFNSNPNQYHLDEYDVIYVGHWDSNADEGFTEEALRRIKVFIESGKGFLVGHDTTAADILDKNNKFSLGSTKEFRTLFNIKTGYSASINNAATLVSNGKIDFAKKFNWGGSEIEVAKTGALMNYPWVIKNPLTIPYTHTAAQIAYGDVWFTFKNGGAFSGRSDYPTAQQVNGGAINFYLTTWNNTAIIQTGHSNGAATADEQKILANVLFYLAQKTMDTHLTDRAGQDTTPPTQPVVTGVQMNAEKKIHIDFTKAVDQGTTYIYKVKAEEANKLHDPIESQEATATIAVGLKGYIAFASNNANLTLQDLKTLKADGWGVVSVDAGAQASSLQINQVDANLDQIVYIYLASVDAANNVSEPVRYVYDPQALELTSIQKQDGKGAKWVELTWTKPEWLKDYKLSRDNDTPFTPASNTYVDREDTIKPHTPEVIQAAYQNGKVILDFLPAQDVQTTHTYKITAQNNQKTYENTAQGIVASGIKGYKITIDNNELTNPSGEVIDNITALEDRLQWISNDLGAHFSIPNSYVHIVAVDNNNNESLPLHVPIAVSYPKVQMQTINRHRQVINDYLAAFDKNATQQKQIFKAPITLDAGAKIAVTIEGKEIDKQQYQIIESQAEPAFPNKSDSEWRSLGDIPKVLPNTKEAYPDLIDEPGYISTRHYEYKFDTSKYPSGTTPPRHETFGSPLGENLVKQKAVKDPGDRYHSQAEGNAFFGNSKIAETGGANKAVKFWGYIIPNETGNYNFGAYSDDGAYGYVIIDNEKKVFVEDWTVAAAYNRSGIKKDDPNTPVLRLEEGKVYPIYMEWYEGCPTHKAFIPSYKAASGGTWTNIPTSWFYASANTTPGDVNEAYFDAYTLENQIPLPSKEGTYYAAIQVISRDGTARQVLNGPFKIQSILPQITSISTTKNFIAPEALSNVSFNTYFQEYSKGIKYEVDFKVVKETELDGKTLMQFDLNKAIVAISIDGGSIEKLRNGTDYTTRVEGNRLIITLNESFNAAAGSTQVFDIYIPTNMGAEIAYGNTEKSYLNQYIMPKKTNNIQVTVKATPRIQEAYTKEDGTREDEKYGIEESKTEMIELNYREISKIN
ncbi:PA14 domain-containing protein [Cellulosilyticum sp. I15G10I2]|uniref:PA14 domain-containing protein n=1 Tax=Cellulosilyticum sp. I15G10I2 TaxID=1892843 RepID=UPI00085CA1B4|nr:PA14 domain-containing protein [Cellulosilyticum sp. I15G10I2]